MADESFLTKWERVIKGDASQPPALPAVANPDRALVAEIAMDIGKSAVSHLRIMYPEAFKALGPSGQRSLRNHIHNEIMAALDTIDADEIKARLERRKADRRRTHRLYDNLRSPTP